MKIQFKIKHSHENKFIVAYSVPRVGGGSMDFVSNFTFSGFSLADCLSQARKGIQTRLYGLRQKGVPVPPAHNIEYEWDRDLEYLPNTMKRQQEFQATMYSAPAELRAVEATPKEPALYEVLKVHDVWTLQKHESPLLTWEQACELLKQKVENNE